MNMRVKKNDMEVEKNRDIEVNRSMNMNRKFVLMKLKWR